MSRWLTSLPISSTIWHQIKSMRWWSYLQIHPSRSKRSLKHITSMFLLAIWAESYRQSKQIRFANIADSQCIISQVVEKISLLSNKILISKLICFARTATIMYTSIFRVNAPAKIVHKRLKNWFRKQLRREHFNSNKRYNSFKMFTGRHTQYYNLKS